MLHQFIAGHVLRVLFVFHGDSMNTPNINLAQLTEAFGTDEKCREALEQLRWPDGPECPRCKSKASPIANRDQYDCCMCHYQFSVTAGTIFHDSHLSLWKWFITTALLCEAKKGMSACQVQRTVGMSYKTAWYLCHRIRAAMVEADKPKLSGQIEMDETYVGGKGKGLEHRGRGTKKRPVIGIRQRNGELRMFHANDVTGRSLEHFLRKNVGKDVDVFFTDEFSPYKGVAKRAGFAKRHHTVNHGRREYVRGNAHTNTIESAISLFKRGLHGSWHKISAKHLQAYLEEMCFRFNNRKNPCLFRDTILKLIGSPNLKYKTLTAADSDAA
jgi:transposase-like protein